MLKVTWCVRVEADPRARPSLLRIIVKRRGARLNSPLAAAQDIWCSLRGESPGHRSRLNHHSWPHCSAGGGQSGHKCVVLAAPWHLEPGPLMSNPGATKQNLRRERHTPGAPGTPGMQQTLTLTPITHQAKSQAYLSTQACFPISLLVDVFRVSHTRHIPSDTPRWLSHELLSLAFTGITKPFRFLSRITLKTELGFREMM